MTLEACLGISLQLRTQREGSLRLNTPGQLCFVVANEQLESTTLYAWKKNTTRHPWHSDIILGTLHWQHLRQSLHNDGFKHLL